MRFWRNVTLIALAHLALIVLALRWAGEIKAANAPEITWVSGAAEEDVALQPETDASTPEPLDSAANKSEIVVPEPTPKPTAKRTPKTEIKKVGARHSSTPAKKKEKEIAAKPSRASKSAANETTNRHTGSGDATSGNGVGKSDAATANYYTGMLHDRFYSAWQQPQTLVASGAKLSAVARIQIEKDGRVSAFNIVRPSGNVLVDESVNAAGRKVTQVDALPAEMSSAGHYDVNVNFALNSE
jgi:TonB family protein